MSKDKTPKIFISIVLIALLVISCIGGYNIVNQHKTATEAKEWLVTVCFGKQGILNETFDGKNYTINCSKVNQTYYFVIGDAIIS